MDVGILALQGDVAEHRAALAELGVTARAVTRPDDMVGLDGIILPGGESTTISLLLESSGLADPLGKELAAGLPAFGTCAGMILLASTVVDGRSDQRSFGVVDLRVRRNGYGRQVFSFEAAVEVSGIDGGPVHAVFIRAPVVEHVGPAVDVLATLASGPTPSGSAEAAPAAASAPSPAAASSGCGGGTPVVCRQGPVLVCAFHPELTADRRLHRLFLSIVEGTDDNSEKREP